MRSDVPDAFHRSVLEDPLFAAEGMDPENGSAALDCLEGALGALERAYGERSIFRKLFLVRYPLARYAIPLDFLRRFFACERMRRDYLASPTRDKALALLDSWQKASDEYAASLHRYRLLHRLLVRIEAGDRPFKMVDGFGHVTSYSYAEHLIDEMLRNAVALGESVKSRRALLHGEPVSPLPGPSEVEIGKLSEGEMTPWQQTIHDAEIAGGTSPYRYVDIQETYGPFRFTLPNFDRIPTQHTFMLYLTKDRSTGLLGMWPTCVDRFSFIDLWHAVKPEDMLVRGAYAAAVGLKPEEMPYWYEVATFMYNSRDPLYWVDIATRIDLDRRPYLNADLVYTQRSSMFDRLLVECARDARTSVAHQKRRVRSRVAVNYSPLYDLLTRSYPSIYYLTFNQSVWRLPERTTFIGDGFVVPASDELSEAEAQEKMTPDLLAKVMGVQKLREERGKAAGWL